MSDGWEPLLTHDRQWTRTVLEGVFRAEANSRADGATSTRRATGSRARNANLAEAHDRDEGKDAAVSVQLGKVVGPGVGLEPGSGPAT